MYYNGGTSDMNGDALYGSNPQAYKLFCFVSVFLIGLMQLVYLVDKSYSPFRLKQSDFKQSDLFYTTTLTVSS